MANFAFDFTNAYQTSATLFATSTGVTTDTLGTGVSVNLSNDVANGITSFLVVGGIAGTGTPTLSAKLQESTDGSTNWTDVTSGAFTAVSVSNTIVPLCVKPTKQYVRSTATVVGTNPVFEATILIGPFPTTVAPVGFSGFSNAAVAGN